MTTTPLHAPERESAAPGSRGRNLTIEGLRGFSAAAVVCYHLHNMAIKGGYLHPHYGPVVAAMIGGLGRFGVLMFFMISGYLIVQSLLRSNSIPQFLKHRVWRIYPVFLVLHVTIFALGPWSNYAWMGRLTSSPGAYALQFLSNLFLLPGTFRLPLAQKNAWSLSYEFAFYLTSCLFFFAAARRTHGGLRLLSVVAAVGASVGFLFCHPAAAYFLVGVGLFLGHDAVGRWRAAQRVPACAGLLFLVFAFLAHSQGRHLTALVLSVPFFFTVVQQTGWFARFLRTRPLLHLGAVSYSLYLVHPFVLYAARAVVRELSPRLHSDAAATMLFAVVGATAALGAANVVYRLVEVAFTNRFLRREHAGARQTKSERELSDSGPVLRAAS